ncbi:LysR family transcriptional regulator [Pseudoalteromonas piscicida]|uniref:LysR family transcriptional regulator n=1 Tax=Pseudoalteromonas piscicida TaxID=43662 RepID=UPI001C96E52E|nr:LysR family transcriptional regulator [Pseudoalteromonas piscicida]QZO14283.1 LysR family transcriptional regulator [Pseudoalteromonas piscicida]WMO13868.1 LysR family transcriptional regulator [Pseudoalteromonas piscicida]
MSTFNSDESLRGITNFVVAANSSSFTEASEKLGITKSAVGKSIAKLEERLGTKLFHRSTRKLSLTGDGEAYLTSCTTALEILDSAENSLSGRQDIPSGVIRIDMPAFFGRHLMMPILTDFSKRYPEIRFEMSFNDRMVDPVEEGFDLVLRFSELKSTNELKSRCLSKQQLYLCATPEYLKQYGTPTHIDDLANHHCIMGYRSRAPLAWKLKNEEGEIIQYISDKPHQIGDGDALLGACLGNMGIVQLPESMVKKHIDSGHLVPIISNNLPDPVELHILWPCTKHLVPKIRLLVDELVQKAREDYFS